MARAEELCLVSNDAKTSADGTSRVTRLAWDRI